MDGMDKILAGWTEAECSWCKGKFYTIIGVTSQTACMDCIEKNKKAEKAQAEFATVTANLDAWIPRWLQKAGMSIRETQAEYAQIPQYLKTAIGDPSLGVGMVLDGRLPRHGFGLSGSAGGGKTFALAAMFKMSVRENWFRRCPQEGMKGTNIWLSWVRWPEKVNQWRVGSMQDKGIEKVMLEVEKMSKIEALVLDDLGAERLKGEYSDDWATSQLDLLIDKRYNAMKPTWFTTNLTPQEFAARYGARMWSRLCGENPLVRIGGHPDLRIHKGKDK